jgi:IclR family KDG regulon transcriptional repressor
MERPSGSDRVQVIDRSVDLLEAVSEGPRSLAEICRATGLSKPTAFRLLAGLAARGVVMKDPVGSTYMLGPSLLRYAPGALAGVGSLVSLGRAELDELASETGETVALHIRSGLERVYVEELPSRHSIRYASLVGSTAPLHLGASGVILLAFMADNQRERTLSLLELSVDRFNRRALEEQLRKARRQGWATSLGTRLTGASAISTPVRADRLLLALSVIGPSSRLSAATLEGFLPSMRRAAEHLAAVLDLHTPRSLSEASHRSDRSD